MPPKYSLRKLWEANPIEAGFQVDFEEREADPSKYTIGQKLHPAADMQQDMDGGNDAMPAPYDGAQMPGGMPPGMPGMGEPQGGPMPDEQLQNIQPGMQPPQTQPGMQEGFAMDTLDIYLNELLDESIDEITEAPFDWERQGNPYMNYGGFNNQRAPASVAAGGPAAIANWQQQARAVDQGYTNPMRQGIGTPPPRFDQGRPVGRYADAGMGAPRGGGMAGPRGGGGGGGGRGPAAGGAGGRTAPQGPDANIRAIQDRLNGMGAGLRPDGLMGPQTRAAIQNFQKGQGITSDGIWGKNTQGAYDRMNANNPSLRPGSPMTDEQSSKLHMMGADARQNKPGTATQPQDNEPGVGMAAVGAGAAGLAANALSRRVAANANPAAQPQYGNRAQQLLNPETNRPGAPQMGNRAQQLLNPETNGVNAARGPAQAPEMNVGRREQLLNPKTNGVADPRVGVNRAGQLGLNTAEENPGMLGRAWQGIRGATGAVGDALGSAGSAVARGAGSVARGLGTAGRFALSAPVAAGTAALSNPLGTGILDASPTNAAELTPGWKSTLRAPTQGEMNAAQQTAAQRNATGNTNVNFAAKPAAAAAPTGGERMPAGTPISNKPPAGGGERSPTGNPAPPPPGNMAAAVQPETVKSQTTTESAMTWNDYMVLFESDKR